MTSMFESKRLKAAFTLVTGILLGSAGAALYNDAQQDKTANGIKAETVEPHILNLGTVDAYSRDNIPLQARISVVGLIPASLQDEVNVRSSIVQTLKQQLAQRPAKDLGVDQQLDNIRSAFMAQPDRSQMSQVTIELPQQNLDQLSRSLTDTVRHTTTGKWDSNADVRLTVEASFEPKTIERYYARKDR